MRDRGFDFQLYEPYTENLFAKNNQVNPSSVKAIFDMITLFEVIEHLEDPLNTLMRIFNYTDNVFFSTSLIPTNIPLPLEWDYYALNHGQHISFFSKKTLQTIAEISGKYFVSSRGNLHYFSSKPHNELIFRFINNKYIVPFISLALLLIRNKKIMESDFLIMSKSQEK